jgi:3-methyl-2-oxobutanoate hydroxymethyltransferase
MTKKVTTLLLQEMKDKGEKISMTTAYDYPTALLVDRAGIEIILVGDSLAMTILGHETTVPVTMDEMIHHIKAVMKGIKTSLVVGDLPFMSYNITKEEAIRNAGRLMKEGGCDVVKLEGGIEMAETVKAIVDAGIPVMGHIGLTPQTISKLGGFKVQGKDAGAAKKIIDDAKALEVAGAFSLILEAIPADVAKIVTESVNIPTIGIGAGIHCDGQVLVFHDMMGLFDRFVPKFVKQYRNLSKEIVDALTEYKEDVKTGKFPEAKHSFTIKEEELKRLY